MVIVRKIVSGIVLLLALPLANASSDPLADVVAPGSFGLGYANRFDRAPYRGGVANRDQVLLYYYEGERFYLHGTRLGLKFNRDAWRFDAFLRHRFEGWTQDRAPASVAGMALREPGIDAGVSARFRTTWGTPYVEVLRDVNRSEGSELKLGYWNEWSRGKLSLRPHASLSLRSGKLNNFYYGVTPAEATGLRPAYTAGGGADGEIALHAAYRLTANWQLFGSVGAVRRSSAVRSSPIVDDRVETLATLGVLYDFSPAAKRFAPESGAPLIVRALYGYSSDCDVLQIVRLSCTSTHTVDKTDVFGVEVGRTLIRRMNDWPLDIGGFLGLLRHREKGFQKDFWQVHGYLKLWYYGFPWDKYVRTRLGFGGGLSYAERISQMELRDQARRGRGQWKMLNYMDPTIDVRLGDILRSPSLKETYVGLGVSHRSGMFGKSQFFGDVNGGSNYIYGYVETSF